VPIAREIATIPFAAGVRGVEVGDGKGIHHFSYCLATGLFSVADFSSGVSLDGLFGELRRPALAPDVRLRAPSSSGNQAAL
jgi:hypothetical protein